MASSHEIANDLAAWSRFWEPRCRRTARTLYHAACLIRGAASGDRADGHALTKAILSLYDLSSEIQGRCLASVLRGAEELQRLQREASA